MPGQLIIRIDPDLKKRLDRLSRAEGKTTSLIVRELVRDYVRQRDIAGYIDSLWNRIGKKLKARGARPSGIAKAVAESRKSRR